MLFSKNKYFQQFKSHIIGLVFFLSVNALLVSCVYIYEKEKTGLLTKKGTASSVIPLYEDKYDHIKSQIGKNGTLSDALRAQGIEFSKTYELLLALSELMDLKRIKSEDEFELVLDENQFVRQFTYMPDKSLLYITAKWNPNESEYEVFQTRKELDIKYRTCEVDIRSNLYSSMIKEGYPPILVFKIQEILQWDIDFLKDLRNGDSFKLIYAERYSDGEFYDIDKIYGLKYSNLKDSIVTVFYEKGDYSGYYTPSGKNFSRAFLKVPLRSYKRISSYFSYSRLHPVYKIRRPHYGVDYAAYTGTPVFATADGTVHYRGWKGGYGRTVIVKHKNGYRTLYAHLSRYGKYSNGQEVKQGDIIAYSGNSGLSTGPHLHYGVYKNNRPVDPLKLDNTAGMPISSTNYAEFRENVDWILKELKIKPEDSIVKKR